MNTKNRKYLKAFYLLPIIFLLFVVSVIGENHRARDIVEAHFENILLGTPVEKCISLHIDKSQKTGKEYSCEDERFLVLLSIMKTLDEESAENISFTSAFDSYWTPTSSNHSISIDVEFKNKNNGKSSHILYNVKRAGFSWSIQNIEIRDDILAREFQTLEKLDLYKYVTVSSTELLVKPASIQPKGLPYEERMLIKYNYQRLGKYLKGEQHLPKAGE